MSECKHGVIGANLCWECQGEFIAGLERENAALRAEVEHQSDTLDRIEKLLAGHPPPSDRSAPDALTLLLRARMMIAEAAPGAFHNGVTGPNGCEEGDVWAGLLVQDIDALLAKQGTTNSGAHYSEGEAGGVKWAASIAPNQEAP